jgi:hypothetical protein
MNGLELAVHIRGGSNAVGDAFNFIKKRKKV